MTSVKISFVVPFRMRRGDSNLLSRLKNCVDTILHFSKPYDSQLELIIVEWNPIEDNIDLTDVINKQNSDATLRIITVPSNIHDKMENPRNTPFLQYAAKNVGIRRANGRWVLSTNADIMFDNNIMGYMLNGQLNPAKFYRTDRIDICKTIDPISSPESKLEKCRTNIKKIHSRGGTVDLRDSLPQLLLSKIDVKKSEYLPKNEIKALHTRMAGDFLMMERSSWVDLNGYPEVGAYAYIDSIMLALAKTHGLSQKIINGSFNIYHQPHQSSDVDTVLSYNDYIDTMDKILTDNNYSISNNSDWGLANQELKQTQM